MSVFENRAGDKNPQAYTNAILGVLGDRDPFEVLRETPGVLEAEVAAVSPDRLGVPEKPGKWSIRQVVQHLADSELMGGVRFRLVLAHDRPVIVAYDQDLWAGRLHYETSDTALALGDFRRIREANLRLLESASEADLARAGVHAERGEESVAHMIRLYAGHDLVHLRQIRRIRATIGA